MKDSDAEHTTYTRAMHERRIHSATCLSPPSASSAIHETNSFLTSKSWDGVARGKGRGITPGECVLVKRTCKVGTSGAESFAWSNPQLEED